MARVPRQFQGNRPNALWVSDLTDGAMGHGFSYLAFVIAAYARRIVSWRVAALRHTDRTLDAVEQALYARLRGRAEDVGHHRDRGAQYVSIRNSERLPEAGLEPSVGRVSDSYGNALAESVIGRYQPDLMGPQDP